MTIYTRGFAPVQIIEAEQRRRWWHNYGSRTEVYDKPPTAAQVRKAKERHEFDIWWAKAIYTGPYPDGSGADRVGKPLGYSTRGNDGWLDENEFRADGGLKEMHEEFERVRKSRRAKP
jgi:hypothetical protein